MLNKNEVLDAVRYNSGQVGKLWRLEELPHPLCDGPIGSEFVAWVCAFQAFSDLKVDGKIGPNTFKVIKIERPKKEEAVETPPKPPDFDNGKTPSNCIIINGKRVKLPQEMIDEGYTATNYLDDGEPRFAHRRRRNALKHFVLHETCGNTAGGCKNTLKTKGYGVQLIQDPWGRFSCHGDLVLDRMVHANQLNSSSFGCEVVNPYNPVYVRDEKLFSNWIPRRWWTWVPGAKNVKKLLKKKGWTSVPKQYVTPTEAQLESMRMFAPWVVKQIGLFPYEFPTAGMKKGSPDIKWPKPGIVAHQDFAGHCDARYMLEDLIEKANKK